MKFTLNWLKEFLDTNADIYQIAEALNKIGHEVEEIIDPQESLKDFIIAEIREVNKHPDADKLNICKVYDGEQILQIVCGAKNVAVGQKIVLAKPGVVIPVNKMQIKKAKIRGVESTGMICAAEELGLEEKSDGIIVLEKSARIGQRLLEFKTDLADPVIDLSITPNRPDCLGVYGIARDLAAFGIGKLKEYPSINYQGKISSPIKVFIKAKEHCSQFASIYITNIKNIESPDWLKNYLISIGCTPRNTVVDLTNYINFSFARPLHAFDADKLVGDLTVRKARGKENFKSLDDKEYILSENDVVVADEKNIQALAGIIGGELSKCDLSTTNILLESAVWDPITISKTSRHYGIETDSKFRFERGVDPEFTQLGIKIAADMIIKICGGEASNLEFVQEVKSGKKEISFDYSLVKKIGGVEITKDQINLILSKLGFEFNNNKIIVPSWRHDVSLDEDIVEEIIRIYGYDNIPTIFIPRSVTSPKILTKKESNILTLANVMAANGGNELITWSFMSSKKADIYGLDYASLKVANPISSELDILRSSIIPNLVEAIEKNAKRSMVNSAFFEVGPVYFSPESGNQATHIAGVRSGCNNLKNIYGDERKVDVFDVKRDIINILEIFGYTELEIKYDQNSEMPKFMHPTRTAHIILRGKSIGFFGELHPQIKNSLKLKTDIVCFEINLDGITDQSDKFSSVQIISDFPPVFRDFAFIVDKEVAVGEIIAAVQRSDKQLIKEVNLFDIYQGEKLEKNKKSIAFSVMIQSSNKTLDNEEINLISDKIIHLVEKKFAGVLRDN